MTNTEVKGRLLSLLVAIAVSVAWETAARLGWVSAIFFPAPTAAFRALVDMSASGALWHALGASLLRLGAGALIGSVVGATLGFAMGALRPIRIVLDPFVAALHPIPKLALFPLFLIILGIGEASRIALVVAAALFPMLLSVMNGVSHIGRFYFEVAKSYGAGGRMMLFRVMLPGSFPSFLTGLRLALNTSLVVVIAVEMLSSDDGLGALVWMAWQTMRIHELFAVLIVIALLGLGFNRVLGFLDRRFARWRPT